MRINWEGISKAIIGLGAVATLFVAGAVTGDLTNFLDNEDHRVFALRDDGTMSQIKLSDQHNDPDIECQNEFEKKIGRHAFRNFEHRQEALASDFETRTYSVQVAFYEGDQLVETEFWFKCHPQGAGYEVEAVTPKV